MVRFQADADLNHHIVRAVRRLEPSIDFRSAVEADFKGRPDPEVLALAADAGRVLVSHDAKTMPRHFADFISVGNSTGLIVVSQTMPIAAVAESLVLIWGATEESEWENRIYWLDL